MQASPLLEKLDWIFTSPRWTTTFPNTMAAPMAHIGSDHVPILIDVGTFIPKSKIFRFENLWLNFDGLDEVVSDCWRNNGIFKNSAQDITTRFKSLRYGIKKWSKSLSQLTTTINNCSYVLALLDGLEEQRILFVAEANFRKILKKHQSKLLEAKRIYWRKRANIRWAKLGDENTIFFSHGSYQELQIQLYQ
jgi:hypothetical protein